MFLLSYIYLFMLKFANSDLNWDKWMHGLLFSVIWTETCVFCAICLQVQDMAAKSWLCSRNQPEAKKRPCMGLLSKVTGNNQGGSPLVFTRWSTVCHLWKIQVTCVVYVCHLWEQHKWRVLFDTRHLYWTKVTGVDLIRGSWLQIKERWQRHLLRTLVTGKSLSPFYSK